MQFTIDIHAPKASIWNILWDDSTFRDWASIIDEGIYLSGEIKEGNEVQFISSVSGYGVTSLIAELNPGEFVLFRHMSDTQEQGERERENEWTGGMESYALTENGGVTTLTVELDVPPEQAETFAFILPKALERIKTLAENSA